MKPKLFSVIKDYASPYPGPIVFQKGEKVKVGQEFEGDPDWENWVWCEGWNDNIAWVPEQYLDTNGTTGVFNRDYNALELTVKAGETLLVFDILNGFGMAERPNGERGWVPIKNLERKP